MKVPSIKWIPQEKLRGKSVLVRIDLGRSLNDNTITDDVRIAGSHQVIEQAPCDVIVAR